MKTMIQEVMNPKLTDVESKTLAIRVAYGILNAADFDLIVDEGGMLTIFSKKGKIAFNSEEYLRLLSGESTSESRKTGEYNFPHYEFIEY